MPSSQNKILSGKSPTGKAHAGFTLIELLTVIAIIGILAAIIIPTVGKVRDSARGSQCASNMRQVALSLRLYADDYKGKLPAARDATVTPNVDWTTQLGSYLPKPTTSGARHQIFTCPSNDYRDSMTDATKTIAYNYAFGPGSVGLNDYNNDQNNTKARTLSSIKNLTMAIWLLESKISDTTWGNATPAVGKGALSLSITAPTTTLMDAASPVAWWHGNKSRTNVAFGDTSVRLMSAAELNARYPALTTTTGYQKAAGF